MDNFVCSQIMLFVSLISELFFVFSLLLMSLLLVSDLQFLRGIENFGQEYDCVFKMNLFADYMTEIDHSDASDASGVGAIDKAYTWENARPVQGCHRGYEINISIHFFRPDSWGQDQKKPSAHQ